MCVDHRLTPQPAAVRITHTPVLRQRPRVYFTGCFVSDWRSCFVSLPPQLPRLDPAVTVKSWPEISLGSLFQGCCGGVGWVLICEWSVECGCICCFVTTFETFALVGSWWCLSAKMCANYQMNENTAVGKLHFKAVLGQKCEGEESYFKVKQLCITAAVLEWFLLISTPCRSVRATACHTYPASTSHYRFSTTTVAPTVPILASW